MKRYKRLLIGSVVLSLALVLLVGCGASQSEYETLQAENASLADEKTSLEVELGQANSDLTKAEADYDTLKTGYDGLNDDYDSVAAELAEIKEVYPPRDFSSLSELRDWLLENDVSEKPVTTYIEDWYGRALEIQEDALKDGYIISVDYDYYGEDDSYDVWCTTIIDGYIWYWDPEIDEVFQDDDFGVVN